MNIDLSEMSVEDRKKSCLKELNEILAKYELDITIKTDMGLIPAPPTVAATGVESPFIIV